MESFLSKFFPEVLIATKNTKRNIYCKYDNQWLTTFTSSLFLTAALSSLVASRVTRMVGRQRIMLFGGAMFLAGAILNGAAINIAMLIIGLYLSETAPAKWRGAFASSFSFFLVLGGLCANITNYFADRIPSWGWRISLGVAAVPGAILVVGALFVSDTPSSLVLRDHPDQARAALQRIRGTDADVDSEFKDIVRAVEEAKQNEKGAFRRLLSKQYRHNLIVGVAIPLFYELTGMTVVAVFLPVLFRTVGFNSQRAILGSVISSTVALFATLLGSLVMDYTGSRFLLITGALGMMLCEVAIAWVMAAHMGLHNAVSMPRNYATGVLVLILLAMFFFGVSWSNVRWPLLSEVYPVEVRSAGQAISVSVWLCLTFSELQAFIKMLCAIKYGVFLVHAGCLLVATIFVALFLPETNGVPLEVMRSVWTDHWFWRRFVKDDKQNNYGFALL
ncbi:hypothetical protein EJB05_34938, partial [Eragrostis curvula]